MKCVLKNTRNSYLYIDIEHIQLFQSFTETYCIVIVFKLFQLNNSFICFVLQVITITA